MNCIKSTPTLFQDKEKTRNKKSYLKDNKFSSQDTEITDYSKKPHKFLSPVNLYIYI